MDTNQNDTNTKQELAVLENTAEATAADFISENNALEDDVTENHVSENTISKEFSANTDDELFKKIDELNNALDDIDIARRILYEQRTALDQQVKLQEQEKRKRLKTLSRLKSKNTFMIFLFNFFMIILLYNIFHYEFMYYTENRDTLYSDYNEHIAALDAAIGDLTQEKENIIQQKSNLQNTLMEQEQAAQLAAQKEHISSQNERSDTTNTILTEDSRKELDAYIASLNRYPSQRVARKQFDGISYYEVVQKYDMEQYMLSDSGNSTIYPGAILRGDSLMQGTTNYTLISQDRTPITLVCSHDGSSVQLENVSYGTVKEAVERLWNESNREYAEKWDYSIRSVQNEESLNLSLGISRNSANLGLGISHTETSSSMAIIFTETYFSVSAEPLKSATQYFQSGCDLKSLGEYEPAYVSSVDYGRRIVVLVTTEMSESELKANLGTNISGIDIGADLSYIKKEIDSGCKICCYGGDSAKTLQAIDNNEANGGLKGWWNEFINGKANDASGFNQMIATDDSLANPVPLAYRLNYLSDNSSVPAVAILNDDIVLAETARLVTLTLEGNLPGTFRLSDSAGAIGYVVNTDQIQITEDGETSGEIQFIWDSSTSAPLTGFFKDSQVSYSLAEMSEKADSIYRLGTDGLFSQKSTDLHIHISDAVYEIP
ncbi:MAG: thiol-activated cytolysin family protein [Lachnospiraceae bacterium]|nr:thiol-activated cytolysin family protein [Lachnospiraceae bacterium]